MLTQKIDRYPKDWPARSIATKRSRQQGKKVQCSYCGKFHRWDKIEVHHTSYQCEKDRAGVNIFPVCGSKQDIGTCHHLVHKKGNWIKDKNIWFNRNTPAIVRRLQRGYAGESSRANVPWLCLAGAIGVFAIGWFVVSAFVGRNKPVEEAEISIVTATVNVREGPGLGYLKRDKPLPKGATVEVLETRGGWVKIGDRSWIDGSYTQVKKQPQKRVKGF